MDHPVTFGVYRSHGTGDITVFKCHVIPRDTTLSKDQKVIASGQQKVLIIMNHPAKFGA